MALPKLQSAVHTLTIPSTGQTVKFRPFVVREQKALLIAQNSNNIHVLLDTLKSIVKACILDRIDTDALAVFDFEYIFTQLRAVSVGEVVELFFACDACQEQTKQVFDLTKLKIEVDPKYNKVIPLFDNVGIALKYPNIDILSLLDDMDKDDIDVIFDIIVDSIDYIYDADQIYHAKEQSRTELVDFVDSLTSEQFARIEAFFDKIPRLQQKVIWDCPHCGHAHNKVMEGLQNFF